MDALQSNCFLRLLQSCGWMMDIWSCAFKDWSFGLVWDLICDSLVGTYSAIGNRAKMDVSLGYLASPA
jgi:hypothetical protein